MTLDWKKGPQALAMGNLTGDGLYIYVCARSGEMSVEDGVWY